jgi:hypothetical protein
MQTLKVITLYGTVSNSATSRVSRNGRKYTAFGVAILDSQRQHTFHYNVVAFGRQGHFAKPLQKGTCVAKTINCATDAQGHSNSLFSLQNPYWTVSVRPTP